MDLHPRAVLARGGWWLYRAVSPFGDGGDYGVLIAGVAAARVRSFTLAIGAAGE